MTPTGKQIREGRALVGMSQVVLAEAPDVTIGLVVRVEQTEGMPLIKKVDPAALMRALEIAGVEFPVTVAANPAFACGRPPRHDHGRLIRNRAPFSRPAGARRLDLPTAPPRYW